MTPWQLPTTADIGGQTYELNTDFRDIIEIMQHLDNPDTPEYLRWQIAMALFYEGEIPKEHHQEAMTYLASFIAYGNEGAKPGPKLLDWEQDGTAIIADVNKVAGAEIRELPHVHWWTFLAYFAALGEGQLSTIVSIRSKLLHGKKLEKWEQEYYRNNKSRIDLDKKYSAEELAEQERLKKLLGD